MSELGNSGGDKDALSMVLYSLLSNVSSSSTPEAVRKPSICSLSDLGCQHPLRVVSALLDVFERHGSGPSIPLKDYASPAAEGGVSLDSEKVSHRPLLGRLIALIILEMSRLNEIVNDVQGPCSSILTSLSRKNVDRVIDNLTTKLDSSPHYIIIFTIGSVASANPGGMVPYLKNILPILLTHIRGKVRDSHKYSYALTFLKLSEAILDNLASHEGRKVSKDDFYKEMDAAHDIFFSNWLTSGSLSRDTNMRNSILTAVGSMYGLISADHLEKATIPNLTLLLSLYKKLPEPYYVSHCISMLLSSFEGKDTDILESILESLLNALFQQVNTNIDHSNKPMSSKNQSEIFRCYDVLSGSPNYNGRLIENLLSRLSAKEESSVVKSMLVLRHLLNSNISKLSDRLDDILLSLHVRLTDPSVQLTVLLGNAGYLRDEIGKEFIQFIDSELIDMCDSILKLLVNGQSSSLLWPNLLDYLYLPEYLNASPSLIRSLSLIVDQKLKNEASNLKIDYDQLSHMNGSYALFSRLLVLSAFPFDRSGGFAALELSKNLVPLIHSKLPPIWDKKVPLLQHYAETINSKNKSSDWDQEQWENWLLALLEDSVAEIDLDEWNTPLIESFQYQLDSFYKAPQRQRTFIIKCLGISIKKSGARLIVLEHLQNLFSSCVHSLPEESESCAKAFGQVSLRHPDLTLDKLEAIFKTLLPKSKSGGLLNYFLRGEKQAHDENRFPKRTIYSCLTEMASVKSISSCQSNFVVDTFIAPALKSEEPSIKLEGIRALSSLAGSPDIGELQQDILLLNTSIHCIKSKDFPDRRDALRCALRILQISKELPDNFKRDLLDACFKYAMPSMLMSENNNHEHDEYASLFKDIITTTMKFDMEQSTLDELFTRLEDYLRREHEPSLITYLDNVTFRIGAPTTFAPGPYMIGSLVPRNAIASLDVVLKILCLYEGRKLPKKEESFFLQASLAHDPVRCNQDIISVLSGCLDKIEASAEGTASVFLGLMEERGREMFNHAPSLVLKIHEKLADVSGDGILGKLLKCIHDDEMLALIWKKLPLYDTALTSTVINYLIDVIHVDELTKEKEESRSRPERIKVIEILPLAAIHALGHLFQVSVTEDCLGNNFGEILVPLMGASIPKDSSVFAHPPYSITQSAIASFLSCKNHNVLSSIIENGSGTLEDPDLDLNDLTFLQFMKHFTSVLVSKLIASFEPFLNHADRGKSLAANGVDTSPLAEKLMARLSDKKDDEKGDSAIKIIILRGFTSYKCPDALVLKLIGSLSDLVDNDDSSVVFNALESLRSVIGASYGVGIPLHVLSTLGLKIRPFFDSGGNRLGEAAIRVFACIVDFHGKGEDCASEVTDQIRGVLTSVLLHANDESPGLKAASLEVASRVSKILDGPCDTSDYRNYLDKFVRCLSVHEAFKDILPVFASNCLSYFSSPKPRLRNNAILLLLSLVEYTPRLGDMVDNICKGLDKLLNDKDQDVRIAASQHLGSICQHLFRAQEDL
ncbi:Maestro heatlike repeat family member 1 [Caligus rogercresseyi]|uniref:Maestro heatlike repeat family member 1 n=1 Tax=Caligus rogercresseyi TaxID=217165 RepID=A0A7T8HI84_CALRO|nr:Maestro heatlike repeat family member 1 [Caligus rogercresseyi]